MLTHLYGLLILFRLATRKRALYSFNTVYYKHNILIYKHVRSAYRSGTLRRQYY